MSGRIWPWQCRRCNAELAIVEDGELHPRPLLPVRVDTNGTVWVRCTAMVGSGRLCNTERGWTVRGRRSRASGAVVSSEHAALSGAGTSGRDLARRP